MNIINFTRIKLTHSINQYHLKNHLQKFLFILTILITALNPTNIFAGDNKLINCDIQKSSCTQTLGDIDVILDITPKPVKAMADLDFIIIISGEYSGENPYIDLNMPAMDMGPNRIILNKTDTNLYKGKGVIVRCKSGHRVWKATVTIPGKGTAEYVFDVVY